MKGRVIRLSILFISSILVVACLALFAFYNKRADGYFFRTVKKDFLVRADTSLTIPLKGWYIAGNTRNNVYLGNTHYVNYLLRINLETRDTQFIQIQQGKLENLPYGRPLMYVDSPRFRIVDGAIPGYVTGRMDNPSNFTLTKEKRKFDSGMPIDDSSYLIRYIESGEGFNLAVRIGDSLISGRQILDKQADGIFCKDGLFRYDPITDKLAYVYFYRNKFIVLTSELKLLVDGKTIDTTAHISIKIGKPSKEGKTTRASPPLYVNKNCTAYNGLLFIQSPVMAQGEELILWEKTSAIDVYEMNSGNYKFSFRISDLKGQKLKEFVVTGEKLIALYENGIRVFHVNPIYKGNRSYSEKVKQQK